MQKRALEKILNDYAKGFFVITLTGPRQSGKTTLVKHVFKEYDYVNLENVSTLTRSQEDPIGFLSNHKAGLIIDEAQKNPELFSYIQVIVDQNQKMGEFILTGSQNFQLLEKITQSLAGRSGILHLLPFNIQEIGKEQDIDTQLIKGLYPPIYDRKIQPYTWYNSYIQNYIERDVRQLVNISNLNLFRRFVKLCAGRSGQILNYSSLSNDVGVSHRTIHSWISILETSFIIFRLHPYHKNYNKRLIKQPKIYFYDTGIVCALLGITQEEQLHTHPLRGEIFETFIVSEHIKQRYNQGRPENCYYWRDNHGVEIDIIEETAEGIQAIEIKSGQTINKDHFKNINKLETYSKNELKSCTLYYTGSENYIWGKCNIKPWQDLLR